MKLKIKDTEITVKTATTEEEQKIGLQNTMKLDEKEGMLFVYPEVKEVAMWMDKTSIPLDMIFVNQYNKIVKIVSRKPNDKSLSKSLAKLVIEVNYGFCKRHNIKIGDSISLPQTTPKFNIGGVMTLYDHKGNAQMKMFGGERIFSRISTKEILRLVNKVKSDNDLIKLGEYVIKEVNAQNKRKPQYSKN